MPVPAAILLPSEPHRTQIYQADNAETAKTRFRRFCHYATGAYSPHLLAPSRDYSISLSHIIQPAPGEITMTRYLLCLFLLITTAAVAQNPIPRQGNSCPTGTYKSGDYCKQFPSSAERGDKIIQKSGSNCPTGFYASGNYCKRASSSGREAITREDGGKCPTGWRKSGGYCVEF